LGRLEIGDGIFPRPAEGAAGVIFDVGDIDRGESTWAHQPGELDGIPTVGRHAVASFVRNQWGGDAPAELAFFRQRALEPRATWPGFRDDDEGCGLGWQVAEKRVEVTVAGTEGPEGDDRGVVVFGNVSDGHRVLVDIHADVQCARLVHGWPPHVLRCRPEAALAYGKLTRDGTGGQPTFPEVMMSR
jgi:hypothetical protein